VFVSASDDFISLAAVSGSTAAGVVLAVVQPVQV
jgi:hypothetical protein